ncbi:hypothetical protein V8E53_001712 [Lactarius tabidus]
MPTLTRPVIYTLSHTTVMVRQCCVTGEKDLESTGRRKKRLGEWLNVIMLKVFDHLRKEEERVPAGHGTERRSADDSTDENWVRPRGLSKGKRRRDERGTKCCVRMAGVVRFSYGFGKLDIKVYKSEDSEERELRWR